MFRNQSMKFNISVWSSFFYYQHIMHGIVLKIILPNKAFARLLFSIYSYTNNNCFPSIQHPYNLTRFGCCKPDIMPISFTNSRLPCLDFEESCLSAIIVPSNNTPCIGNREYVIHQVCLQMSMIKKENKKQ
jgi:hypothetical protein